MSDSPDWSYLTQVTDFEMMMSTDPVSARARALWYRLMYHWNKTYWNQPLVLTETVLRGELNLSHKQFLDARSELKESGYIRHQPQGGRKPGKYWLRILRPPEALQEKKAAKRRIWEENFIMFTTNTEQTQEEIHEEVKKAFHSGEGDNDFTFPCG